MFNHCFVTSFQIHFEKLMDAIAMVIFIQYGA